MKFVEYKGAWMSPLEALHLKKGEQFIDELNAIIEMQDESDLAEDLLKEHLKSFDAKTMRVSKDDFWNIQRMRFKHGIH